MGYPGLALISALMMSCSAPAEYVDASAVGGDRAVPTCEKEGDYLDVRPAFAPAPEDGIEIRTPAFEIPPYSQVFWCYWGTYKGPTTGVTHFRPFQADGYDHHNLLRAVTGVREDDGVMGLCPSAGAIGHYGPMYWPTGVEPGPDVENWLNLPDGVAMQLQQDQKWVLDMHYINPTGCTLLVQNGVNLGTLAAEEVESWAAPIRLDAGDTVEIPANSDATIEFECEWPDDINVLSVGAHMHDMGANFSVDLVHTDGVVESVYEIEEWDPEYRNFPLMLNYPDGGIAVEAGDSFRTNCSWSNTTDEDIRFPDEMCSTLVSAYPVEQTMTCNLGVWMTEPDSR